MQLYMLLPTTTAYIWTTIDYVCHYASELVRFAVTCELLRQMKYLCSFFIEQSEAPICLAIFDFLIWNTSAVLPACESSYISRDVV